MNLRQSMSGLHTWSGLLVSWLLFVIVFAGSLASFDKELTRWMQPDLHLPGAQSLGADQVRDWLRQRAPMPMPGGCCRRASGRPTGTPAGSRATAASSRSFSWTR